MPESPGDEHRIACEHSCAGTPDPRVRDNVTGYDAVYLALAEVLDAPLLTFDAELAAASGHRAVVEVLG